MNGSMRRILPWIPFGMVIALLFSMALWVVWPRWWDAVAFIALVFVYALGRRELVKRGHYV